MKLYPSYFISHGSPMAAISEDDFSAKLQALGQLISETGTKPKAVVICSAHGESASNSIEVVSSKNPKLIYDFGGFPDELFRFRYPCPGSLDLANEVKELLIKNSDLKSFKVTINDKRGFDHGVWVPLSKVFPNFDVPVVEVTMPTPTDPKTLYQMGRALKSLREKDILLLGSGGATHNLRRLSWHDPEAKPEAWVLDFHNWLRLKVETKSIDDLLDYLVKAPAAKQNHPTPDHYYPLLFTMGTLAEGDQVETIIDTFQLGNLSLFSFRLS